MEEEEDNMTLRRMRLRRKADPKTGKRTLCEPAQAKRTWTFQKSQGKCRARIPGTAFCASLRRRNARGHFTRAILCGNLQEECGTPIPRHTFCAGLRNQNAHGHFTRAILSGNLQGVGRTRMVPPRLNTGP